MQLLQERQEYRLNQHYGVVCINKHGDPVECQRFMLRIQQAKKDLHKSFNLESPKILQTTHHANSGERTVQDIKKHLHSVILIRRKAEDHNFCEVGFVKILDMGEDRVKRLKGSNFEGFVNQCRQLVTRKPLSFYQGNNSGVLQGCSRPQKSFDQELDFPGAPSRVNFKFKTC